MLLGKMCRLGSESLYLAALVCAPAVIMELVHNEVDKITSILTIQHAIATDRELGAAMSRGSRYMQLRPLRLRLARVLAVDSSLPIAYFALLFTHTLLIMQLHNFL
ncbi:uncharacterized protein LOC133517507 [Cydia pomonella]|uniref:uncharacterized protein LOC133517507 n=1 Tax=Cydia pomonella TaxID=82600 RepID=UPI002ADE8DEA|nr:uncharacterized protein LOC133517507 [Cydia pomonella]